MSPFTVIGFMIVTYTLGVLLGYAAAMVVVQRAISNARKVKPSDLYPEKNND